MYLSLILLVGLSSLMGDVRKVFGVKGFPLTGMPECKETKCIVMTAYAGSIKKIPLLIQFRCPILLFIFLDNRYSYPL